MTREEAQAADAVEQAEVALHEARRKCEQAGINGQEPTELLQQIASDLRTLLAIIRGEA
jgi:signal transduction histidine kinase